MENLKTILNACLRVYGADFTVNNRKQNNVYARAAYYSLAKSFTNHSLDKIGRICGGRDHSTVIHALHKAKAYKMLPEYRRLLAKFEHAIDGLLIFKEENEIETYHTDLIKKIKNLELENQQLRKNIYDLKKVTDEPTEPIQIRVTKTIMKLPDDVLRDFERYRLLPFLKMQQSKVLN